MNYRTENGDLVVYLSGRIDSANADSTEKEISAIRSENGGGKLILDAENLEYISSAGLRVVLRLKKAEPTLAVINVNPEVYEIFDMTGFTEMMDVKKAYRRISIEGCEAIGAGANGKVYRINEDTIVKVYLNPNSLDDIRRERDLAKKAFVLGIPTAISYDIARVGDGYGTVFELLDAKSLAKLVLENPEKLDFYVGVYVDLLKKIHATSVKEGDMPDMKEIALKWARFDKDYLPKETGEKLLALVNAVPKDNHLLHGDYHIKNVMMQDGEALLIDMDTLCLGNPVFELGSMFNAYEGFSSLDVKDDATIFLGITKNLARRFWRKALEKYLGTSDEKRITEVENKAKIVGYMRLLRRAIRRGGLNDENEKKAIEFYMEQLINLISSVDTLEI